MADLLERLTRWNLCGIRYFIVSSVPAAHTYANAAMNRYSATFLCGYDGFVTDARAKHGRKWAYGSVG